MGDSVCGIQLASYPGSLLPPEVTARFCVTSGGRREPGHKARIQYLDFKDVVGRYTTATKMISWNFYLEGSGTISHGTSPLVVLLRR